MLAYISKACILYILVYFQPSQYNKKTNIIYLLK